MWEVLAADEDKEVLYAEVDISANKALARRFDHLQPFPKAVMLRDRMVWILRVLRV